MGKLENLISELKTALDSLTGKLGPGVEEDQEAHTDESIKFDDLYAEALKQTPPKDTYEQEVDAFVKESLGTPFAYKLNYDELVEELENARKLGKEKAAAIAKKDKSLRLINEEIGKLEALRQVINDETGVGSDGDESKYNQDDKDKYYWKKKATFDTQNQAIKNFIAQKEGTIEALPDEKSKHMAKEIYNEADETCNKKRTAYNGKVDGKSSTRKAKASETQKSITETIVSLDEEKKTLSGLTNNDFEDGVTEDHNTALNKDVTTSFKAHVLDPDWKNTFRSTEVDEAETIVITIMKTAIASITEQGSVFKVYRYSLEELKALEEEIHNDMNVLEDQKDSNGDSKVTEKRKYEIEEKQYDDNEDIKTQSAKLTIVERLKSTYSDVDEFTKFVCESRKDFDDKKTAHVAGVQSRHHLHE